MIVAAMTDPMQQQSRLNDGQAGWLADDLFARFDFDPAEFKGRRIALGHLIANLVDSAAEADCPGPPGLGQVRPEEPAL